MEERKKRNWKDAFLDVFVYILVFLVGMMVGQVFGFGMGVMSGWNAHIALLAQVGA